MLQKGCAGPSLTVQFFKGNNYFAILLNLVKLGPTNHCFIRIMYYIRQLKLLK